MNLFVVILIAISLSMDAFSLALSIGTLSFSKKNIIILSLIVGIFHFFMPIFGSYLGIAFINKFNINIHFLSSIIFAYIAIQMFKEFREDHETNFNMKLVSMLIFATGVSLDSFGVGFTFNKPIIEIMKITIIFTIFSASFTYIGVNLGKFINKLIGSYAIVFGAVIMLILAIINFVNFCAFN